MAAVRPPVTYNQNSVDANLKALRNQYEQQAAMDINQMVKDNYQSPAMNRGSPVNYQGGQRSDFNQIVAHQPRFQEVKVAPRFNY